MTVVAVIDPAVRPGFVDALRAAVPATWVVTTDPAGADVLVTERLDIGPSEIARVGRDPRLIATLDPGHPHISVDVPTFAVPNTALTGVAEHAIMLMLACCRGLLGVSERTRAMDYLADRSTPTLTTQTEYTFNWIGIEQFGILYGQTVGLIGLGYVGQAVAARLRPFGVKLLYWQRSRQPAAVERALGVEYRPFEELLSASNIVSLHHRFQDGPDGNDRHIDHAAFALMQPGAVLVNTARGRLVDEEALVAALESGHLRAAGLDVFRYEPLPDGHPFLRISPDRLLLTPHVAGAPNEQAWRLMSELVVERAIVAIQGAVP